MKLFAAPLQGFTEAPWRLNHARIYGCVDEYFTPFLRVEKGEVRPKDERDISSSQAPDTVPQLIFRDLAEFEICRDVAINHGYRRIDLNLGCPYPPQVKLGRGSGALSNIPLLKDLSDYIGRDSGITYSVKMRLGVNEPDEWKAVVDILNDTPLAHVCLHPRTARQQYKGDIHTDQFEAFLTRSRVPVVYNGDICSPEQISAFIDSYPALHGIMAGRGLLARPSLFSEFVYGEIWDRDKRLVELLHLHSALFEHYSSILCGDAQILSKLKPLWEYMGTDADRKSVKAIKKATTLEKYLAAVASIR